MLFQPLVGNRMGVDFVIAEWKAEVADYWIAPLHRHRDCDEAWYVLEGALEFKVGEQEFVAEAGSGVYVPKGTPHSFRNAAGIPTRYLIFMTAKTDRMIRALHSLESRDRESVARVFEAHDAVLM